MHAQHEISEKASWPSSRDWPFPSGQGETQKVRASHEAAEMPACHGIDNTMSTRWDSCASAYKISFSSCCMWAIESQTEDVKLITRMRDGCCE